MNVLTAIKTVGIFNNFQELIMGLQTNNIIHRTKFNNNYLNSFSNKYITSFNVIKQDNDVIYSLKAWKSKCFYNHIMENYDYNKNYIMCCDFMINKKKDNIKIDYLAINNDYYDKEHNIKNNKAVNINLSETDELILRKNIINYIENIAREEKINKIIIDIHNNLYRFNAELKNEGFVNTYRYCADNPFWFEAEKNIHYDNRLDDI